MFHLSFNCEHKVLLSTFSGRYTPEDITLRDNAVRRFVARRGLAHGILDFTAVESVEVPLDTLIRRAHQPAILQGYQRVFVVPQESAFTLSRLVAAHQRYARGVEPLLVRSLADAYGVLGITNPTFVPIAADAASQREKILHDILRRLNKRGSRVLDGIGLAAVLERLTGRQPLHSSNGLIRISDVFNAALGQNALRDADIEATCPSCNRSASLSWCSIAPGRTTTYSCEHCDTWLLKFSFAPTTDCLDIRGYVVGHFDVLSQAPLDFSGVVLPKSET